MLIVLHARYLENDGRPEIYICIAKFQAIEHARKLASLAIRIVYYYYYNYVL